MTRPGTRLRALAVRLFDARTMERLIDPVIADLQCEHHEATRHGQVWRARWIRITSCVAFWKVAATAFGWPSAGALTKPDAGGLGRTVRFSGIATTAVTLLLLWPPQYYYSPYTIGHRLLMMFLSVPGTLSIALPMGLVFGVMSGLRGRIQTRRSQREITLLILATCLATMVIDGWILPASNQAFRELMAGGRLSRGVNELTFGQLWQSAQDRFVIPTIKNRRTFDFNFRLALGFAPLVLGLFSLAVASARRRPSSGPAIGVVAVASCFSYYSLLYRARLYWARIDIEFVPAIAAAWGANLVFLVLALLLWKTRTRARSGADPSRHGDDPQSADPPATLPA